MGDFLERNIMSSHVIAFLRKEVASPWFGVQRLTMKHLEGKRTKHPGWSTREPSPGWESSSRAHSAGLGTNPSIPWGSCCWFPSAPQPRSPLPHKNYRKDRVKHVCFMAKQTYIQLSGNRETPLKALATVTSDFSSPHIGIGLLLSESAFFLIYLSWSNKSTVQRGDV